MDTTKRRRRRAIIIAAVVALVAAVILAVIVFGQNDAGPDGPQQPGASSDPSGRPSPSPSALDGVDLNLLEQQRIGELLDYSEWLDDNGATAFVGEMGWPKNEVDADAWNALAEKWYTVAEDKGLWSTTWAAGSSWSDDYPLTVYGGERLSGLDAAGPQASVVEEFAASTDVRVGVNLSGLDFGTGDGYSNVAPGVLGQTYFDEPAASYSFLADRGVDLVRLPVMWERLQAEPYGDLRPEDVALVRDALDAAEANGVDVVLDLHNYGKYATESGELQVGTDALPASALSDVWLKLAAEFGDHPALLAYGLMNEPFGFEGDQQAAAGLWEDVSQEVLTAIRESGDETLVMVGGYDYSSLARWSTNHPDGWIDDPADNFRYEAHHYWDGNESGVYADSYEAELSAFGGE
ncbi:glycoside hydrolase family 5 protein [Marisediminicola senii]|uniref:glycoside hydrolase family 5 protein n=1 Tax=Marisediminicola senii TaxID=2711233 RepID=UPI0013EC31ED|nr:cellulase family glycosylhydrolase [Marisediminicola senii]